jgi:hypothetical protein
MASRIVADGATFSSGTPIRLFPTNIYGSGNAAALGRQYDVTADGRFLINVQLETGSESPISLIQNWDPESSANP